MGCNCGGCGSCCGAGVPADRRQKASTVKEKGWTAKDKKDIALSPSVVAVADEKEKIEPPRFVGKFIF